MGGGRGGVLDVCKGQRSSFLCKNMTWWTLRGGNVENHMAIIAFGNIQGVESEDSIVKNMTWWTLRGGHVENHMARIAFGYIQGVKSEDSIVNNSIWRTKGGAQQQGKAGALMLPLEEWCVFWKKQWFCVGSEA